VSDYHSRRRFVGQLAALAAMVTASKWTSKRAFAQAPGTLYAYVGCFTTANRDASGKGINVYRVDAQSRRWDHVQLVPELVNPSFLAVDRTQRFLYSVHGDENYATAFAIDPDSGRLRLLNRQDTGGTNGVHLAVDSTNRFLIVSNYASGSMAVLPIDTDGSLATRSDLVDLPGKPGPHPVQQTSSHPHHNPFDPDGRFFIVPDKGLDRVFVFKLDSATGKLAWAETPSISTRAGAGPRHAAFHPTLPFAYVLNELDSTVATYDYGRQNGALTRKQLLSTRPDDFTGANTTAEIAVHPSGRFLYCSNRGHDSIASFAIDPADGRLRLLDWTPSGGERPRYFGLDPSGSMLYACNERSHNIVAYRVNPQTGALTATGYRIASESPVTLVFATAAA